MKSEDIVNDMVGKSPYGDQPIFTSGLLFLGEKTPLRTRLIQEVDGYRNQNIGAMEGFIPVDQVQSEDDARKLERFCYSFSRSRFLLRLERIRGYEANYWADLLSCLYLKYVHEKTEYTITGGNRIDGPIMALRTKLGNKYLSEEDLMAARLAMQLFRDAYVASSCISGEDPRTQSTRGGISLGFVEAGIRLLEHDDLDIGELGNHLGIAADSVVKSIRPEPQLSDYIILTRLRTAIAVLASTGILDNVDPGVAAEVAISTADRACGMLKEDDYNYRRILKRCAAQLNCDLV